MPTVTSEEPKAGCWELTQRILYACLLHATPLQGSTAKPPKPPLWPNPWTHPRIPHREPAHPPPPWEGVRLLLLAFSQPPAVAGAQ